MLLTKIMFAADTKGSFVMNKTTGELFVKEHLDCCDVLHLQVVAKDQGIPSLDSKPVDIEIILYNSQPPPPTRPTSGPPTHPTSGPRSHPSSGPRTHSSSGPRNQPASDPHTGKQAHHSGEGGGGEGETMRLREVKNRCEGIYRKK